MLEVAGPERAKGIILGKTERGSVICLPEDTRLNKHIAVFGASGTMKSRGVIRPALFPVSYTHLDVYKRQVWRRTLKRKMLPPAGNWARAPSALSRRRGAGRP